MQRVLIANRGEIAVRIIRACRELGLETVAVYSEADEDSLHAELADIAVCVGPAAAGDSYLKIANIISAAEVTDVDAIHPGYGFLAENAHFADVCRNCRITFVGPSAENIRLMGDKAEARRRLKDAGVPVTPGSEGLVESKEQAVKVAREIGYPVVVKAAAGGGGKGMRVAHNDVSLAQAFMTAGSEAERSFGNPALYMERFVERARHVEVQVFGDGRGGAVHLGERDCSIQRRHQKLIEEAPCPILDDSRRKRIGEAAVLAVEAVNYCNAGTVEFLYDEITDEFYFMEMNTRIQVEHPVTEVVTGIDLVKEQLLVAAGEPLSLRQPDIRLSGHAIEARINAEDPDRDFAPRPGKIEWLHLPGGCGLRVDSHVYSGYVVSPYYDSILGKIIAHGRNREEAVTRLIGALDELIIDGVPTTAKVARAVLADARFADSKYTTGFLDHFMQENWYGKGSH